MTRRELESLVARGEGANLEFKKRTPEPDRIAREMVALANSGSGKILIGVEDDGAILGVTDSTEEEFAVRKAVDAWCLPPVRWNIRRVEVSRKREVLVISIPTARSGPHTVRRSLDDPRGRMYVRFNDESVVASPEAYMIASRMSDERPSAFEFGSDELLAMKLLDKADLLTVSTLAQEGSFSPFRARQILTQLTITGVIRHVTSRPEDYFVSMIENE